MPDAPAKYFRRLQGSYAFKNGVQGRGKLSRVIDDFFPGLLASVACVNGEKGTEGWTYRGQFSRSITAEMCGLAERY